MSIPRRIRRARGARGADAELRRRNAQLAALNAVIQAVGGSLDLRAVLRLALDKALAIAEADVGSINLVDRRQGRIHLAAQRGIPPSRIRPLRTVDLETSPANRVVRSAKPWVVDNLQAGHPGIPPTLRQSGIRGFATLPMTVRGQVLGLLNLGSLKPRRFRPEDVRFFGAIARQIGVAVENARLYEAARKELTERRRAEKALRVSGSLYRTTIDALDEWLHMVDRDLRFVYLNVAFRDRCRTLGLDPDAIGKRVQEVFPFLPATVLDEYRQVFETGRPCNTCESTVVDGRTFFTETRKIPVRERGRVARVITVIRDVTERQLSEQALRESESRFSKIFLQNPVAMAITSRAEGRFLDVNATWERLFGYARGELLGRTSLELGLFADPAEREARLRQASCGERSFAGVEIRLRTKSGEVRDLLASTQELDLGGEACFLSTFQDITGRKQTEEALRDSEIKYRTLFEAESDTLFMIDNGSGRILEVNSAAVALYGYSRDELLRMRNVDLSAQPDETRRATQTGLTLIPLRFHRRKDGTVFPVEITACHIVWHGRPVHLAAIRDITTRQRAEAAMRDLSHRLLQAQEEERRRIARDLHDSTAQKLAGLIMALGRLDEAATGEAARKPVAECLATAEDCVREIRSLSHLLHPPLLDELGLEVALDTYIQGFSKQSGVAVKLDAPADLDRLPGDVELTLFRIVQESLGNVLKHSGCAEATVQLARLRDRVLLEIRDRGRGIPAERLERLRNRQPDTGMGIAGMRERLEPLGGQLEIDSSTEGTVIRAVVPIPPGTP